MPPDVFARVGRERGWGNREQWTHYDGYQVASGGHLRALVGGNARYGGLLDLCSISRDDGRENTVARFAVIRSRTPGNPYRVRDTGRRLRRTLDGRVTPRSLADVVQSYLLQRFR